MKRRLRGELLLAGKQNGKVLHASEAPGNKRDIFRATCAPHCSSVPLAYSRMRAC